MGLGDVVDGGVTDPNLEHRVRETVREHGLNAVKSKEEGQSGKLWELDAIVFDEDDNVLAYFEVKEPKPGRPTSTRNNHMTRAGARLADFRNEEARGAVVVPDKDEFTHGNWEEYFESIDASLLGEDDVPEFLDGLPKSDSELA